jgi:hypothetical protein
VRIFHVAEGEKVVSVTRLAEDAEAAAEDAAAAAAAGEAAAPTQLPMDGGAGEDEAPESGET